MSPHIQLSRNQQLIQYGQSRWPDLPLYDSAFRFRLRGPIEPVAFQDGFQKLVRSTDVMSLSFVTSLGADEPGRAAILSDARLRGCEYVDLSDSTSAHQQAEVICSQRLAAKLDPTGGLYDSLLLRLAPDESVWWLKVNHLLVDGGSVALLFRRQEQFYRAELEGTEPTPGGSWREYVEYEQQFCGSSEFAASAKYWADKGRTALEPTRFYQRSAAQLGPQHTRVKVGLGLDRTASLKSLALRDGFRALTPDLSAFNILVTAVFAWLSHLDGLSARTVGVTSHGRSSRRFHDTVGLFMQLLPFRVAVEEEDTFKSLAKKVAAESLTFLRHAVPGSATPESGGTFDVAVNFIPASFGTFCGFESQVEWLQNGYDDSDRRLGITIHDFSETGAFELLFDFNDAVFSPSCRHSASRHLLATIDCMIANPEQTLREVSLLSAEEKIRIQDSLVGTRRELEPKSDLWSVFCEIVDRRPSHNAVESWDGQIGWQELRDRALEVGGCLKSQGIGLGDVVPLVAGRSRAFVEGALGILVSGAAFLPVDPDLPPDRIEWMIDDAQARMMLQATGGGQVVAEEVSARRSGPARVGAVEPAAYVMYTSGSTGLPNGVVVGHRSVINLLTDMENLAPLPQKACCSWWTNVGFDVSIYEVFSALLFGRTLAIPHEETRLSPAELFPWMCEKNVASAYLPPFMLQDFHDWLDQNDSALLRLLVGVEPIPQRLLAAIACRLKPGKVVNGYGPTEATVCATFHPISETIRSEQPAPIGRPINNTHCQVVNEVGRPCPVGVVGELYIGGAGLALEYLRRPELTSSRFVDDPSASSKVRYYRTGDLVRLNHDGALEFHGRIDDQLKLRGQRIEPAEISNCLQEYPGVRESVVTLTEDAGQGRQLCAYYSSADPLDSAQLRAHVARRLPRLMVPAGFVHVAAIPRNRNGKVDYGALPTSPSFTQERAFDAPKTERQRQLARIWSDVLGVERVGLRDDFFALGGDSILAIQISALARKQGIQVQVRDMFDRPTLAELADQATGIDATEAEQGLVEGPVELAPIQHWFLQQAFADAGHWGQSVLVEPPSNIEPNCLDEALRRVAMHHDALRLSLSRVDGGWKAENRRELPATWNLLRDWRSGSVPNVAQAEEQLHAAFELDAGCMLNAALLETDEGTRLLIAAHHMVVDAVSWSILLEDLATTYHALQSGAAPSLPHKTTAFRDWTKDLGVRATSAELSEEAAYWSRVIQFPVLELPRDETNLAENNVGSMRLVSLRSGTDLAQRLTEAASSSGYRVHEMLVAALVTTLGEWTGQDRFRIDTEGHGRNPVDKATDLTRTVGWFTSLHPIAFDLSQGLESRSVLDHVRSVLRGVPHGGVGFGVLRYLTDSSWRTAPSSTLVFNHLGHFGPNQKDSSFRPMGPLSLSRSPGGTRPYCLEIATVLFAGCLETHWYYSKNIHCRDSIDRVADKMQCAVEAMVEAAGETRSPRLASEFPLAKLDARKLGRLEAALQKSDRARRLSS